MIGGVAMRKACGSTTWRSRCPDDRPMAPAASVCPFGHRQDRSPHDLGTRATTCTAPGRPAWTTNGRPIRAPPVMLSPSTSGCDSTTGADSATYPPTTATAITPPDHSQRRAGAPVRSSTRARHRRQPRPRPPPRRGAARRRPSRCRRHAGRRRRSRPPRPRAGPVLVGLLDRRQRGQRQRVHEDDDEQRRHVAEDLDVGARGPPHQPVARQAGDAEQGPQDEREDDAHHRHRDGVAQPGEDRRRAPCRTGRGRCRRSGSPTAGRGSRSRARRRWPAGCRTGTTPARRPRPARPPGTRRAARARPATAVAVIWSRSGRAWAGVRRAPPADQR